MSMTLITGVPGSGKSLATVGLIKEWHDKGHPIFTNGLPDLKLPHVELTDAQVAAWHEEGLIPERSVVIVDEAQRIWPPAAATSQLPPGLKAFETHRHRAVEFVIVTQHPSFLHAHIRKLVGRHIHIRNLGPLLGRMWYEWPECSSPERYASAPIKERYKLDKRLFGLYKSASQHIKVPFKVPNAMKVIALGVVIVAVFGTYTWRSIQEKITPKPAASAAGAAAPGQAAPGAAPSPGSPAARSEALAVAAPVPDREPFAGIAVHLAGSWVQDGRQAAYFALLRDGLPLAVLRDRQVIEAGYSVRWVAPCVVVLGWAGKERVVTCAPARPAAPARASAASAPV